MKLLEEMRKDLGNENTMTIPGGYIVTCHACNWKDQYNRCDSEEASDGWEYPTYTVPTCPKCGEGIEI